MNNDETIELTALCGALADGTITGAQQERLNAMLKGSDAARQFYVRHAALSASLYSYAAEMQSDAPRAIVAKPKKVWWIGAAAAAAAAVLMLGVILWPHQEVPSAATETKLVASMTGTKDCVWSGAAMQPGVSLQAGQRLNLAKGFAEITFDSGAQVTMEGPATMVVSSAWGAQLESGTVKASVPEEAIGFRVSHPSVDVVDLGTEFSMIADAVGAEVLVLKGSVEAAAHGDSKTLVLREQESRRFASDGVTDVGDRERKFARFTKVLKLDRAAITGDYAHWSFDENTGAVLTAEARNKKKGTARAKFDANALPTLTEGRWNKSLNFNGRIVAKATVPGISAPSEARTIAFWVRVPEGAPMKGGSSSILGWGQRSKKHGAQTARIAWNRSPAQGPAGAIRTELGRLLVMGSTNVRDGRWHHVAVALVPDAGGSVHVKQYVDGRLDGSSADNGAAALNTEVTMDTLWLGRGPLDRSKEAFFTGALDELFVIDRALSPTEIVRLMHENQPDAAIAASL
jgi:ferric-dicitrate binding protein FerR (iron transport regulator)